MAAQKQEKQADLWSRKEVKFGVLGLLFVVLASVLIFAVDWDDIGSGNTNPLMVNVKDRY